MNKEKDYKFTEKDIKAVNGFVDFLNGATGSNIEKFKIPCEYCSEEQKHIEEIDADAVYLEIYGKHLRLNGKLMGLRFGRDFMINYCPMCGRKLEV